jgi:hypothetical protein
VGTRLRVGSHRGLELIPKSRGHWRYPRNRVGGFRLSLRWPRSTIGWRPGEQVGDALVGGRLGPAAVGGRVHQSWSISHGLGG